MTLWRSDGDEKLLPSFSARPSTLSRPEILLFLGLGYLHIYIVYTLTYIYIYTFTPSHYTLKHIYGGARVRTDSHILMYIFYVHTQSTARGD